MVASMHACGDACKYVYEYVNTYDQFQDTWVHVICSVLHTAMAHDQQFILYLSNTDDSLCVMRPMRCICDTLNTKTPVARSTVDGIPRRCMTFYTRHTFWG